MLQLKKYVKISESLIKQAGQACSMKRKHLGPGRRQFHPERWWSDDAILCYRPDF